MRQPACCGCPLCDAVHCSWLHGNRWSALIAAASPSELRTYGPGEHMRGIERALYDQARAEFMREYGAQLADGGGAQRGANGSLFADLPCHHLANHSPSAPTLQEIGST